MQIILASGSARRREILNELKVPFKVIVSHADETLDKSTQPSEYVKTLSLRKATAVANSPEVAELQSAASNESPLIIASDTVVVCDGKILKKPKSIDDARDMLTLLSGRAHTVMSGIAVIYNEKTVSAHEETQVFFRKLDESEIEAYISTDEPYDKAGGYGIQDTASIFVERIDGDYLNVVGLPVYRLFELLKREFGIGYFDLVSPNAHDQAQNT